MPRTNKVTSGVFTNLIGTDKVIPSYKEFLNYLNQLDNKSDDLNKYITKYRTVLSESDEFINSLGVLEEIILQMASRDNLTEKDIKLSIVREYIYARTPFYRREKNAKDIRIINGLVEFFGDDTDKLESDKSFMKKAKEKLIESMNEEIQYNTKKFEKIFK